jgi:hypothetical protein
MLELIYRKLNVNSKKSIHGESPQIFCNYITNKNESFTIFIIKINMTTKDRIKDKI